MCHVEGQSINDYDKGNGRSDGVTSADGRIGVINVLS